MTAIIRIKRNCTEDPLDAVLINCKRRKIEDDASETDEDVARVLSFAGTVTDRDEDFVKHIPVLTKTEAEEQYKKHKVDVTEKLRLENLIRSKNSRYTVVNSCRFSKGNAEEAVDLNCTIVDVEAAERDSGIESASGNYVYDLYYTNSDDFGETDINELISVYPLSEGLVYGSARDNGDDPESDYSEDSNAENYWKNDYPDESDVDIEEDDSAEEDATDRMKKMSLFGKDELSSDDYDKYDNYDYEDYEDYDDDSPPH